MRIISLPTACYSSVVGARLVQILMNILEGMARRGVAWVAWRGDRGDILLM